MTAKTIILGIADPDNNQTVSGVGRAVLDPDSIATVTFARDMDEDDLRAVTTGAVMFATAGQRILNGDKEGGVGEYRFDEQCRLVADDRKTELFARLLNWALSGGETKWASVPPHERDSILELAGMMLDTLRKSDDPETDKFMEQL